MQLSYYRWRNLTAVSPLADLPLERLAAPCTEPPSLYLFRREAREGRISFRASDPRQLTAVREDVSWLDPDKMAPLPPAFAQALPSFPAEGGIQAVNTASPRWEDALAFPRNGGSRKKRVHLLAVGDVGGTLLTALKLLGGGCVDSIGICDLNANTCARWTAEMNQISWPWDYDALPLVETVAPEDLFQCDVFIFAASKSVPPVGSGVRDVRMAQLEANRPLVEGYARQARQAGFRGLFAVLSDPVDPLCRAAWAASNQNEDGVWDFQGLLPEQVQGFGLGVMNARAADLARQDPRFHSFLEDGRSFGPHGRGLVIANSISRYDDALSRELTEQVETANLRIRALGFKPYVAPAVSSGAMQLLLTLQGQWHCGSVCLGGVWFGVRNRYTASGLETETLPLPDALYARLQETETLLRNLI